MGPLLKALNMIFSINREVYSIAFLSVFISLSSTVIASIMAIISGIFISKLSDRYKTVITAVLSTLTALPTVIIGLFVYSLITRNGPFGQTGLLFTPYAIIIGQILLAFPIITTGIVAGISRIKPDFFDTLKTFGVNGINSTIITLSEIKPILLSVFLSGFGRTIGEVGVSMILGGNIRHHTRTITTAIALESSKGELVTALALGIILVTISLIINFLCHYLGRYNK